ncbi:MAG: hypothetical protein ACP5M9_03115 [Candidatus Micrarchaeia archaeon]
MTHLNKYQSKHLSERITACINKFNFELKESVEFVTLFRVIKQETNYPPAAMIATDCIYSQRDKNKALEVTKKLARVASDTYDYRLIGDFVRYLSTDRITGEVNHDLLMKLSFLRRKTRDPFKAMDLLRNSNNTELIKVGMQKLPETLEEELRKKIEHTKAYAVIYYAKEFSSN